MSRKGNVMKRCGCGDWETCDHQWCYYYGSRANRRRGSLDMLLGRHPADLATAQEEARLLTIKIDLALRGQSKRAHLTTKQLLWLAAHPVSPTAQSRKQVADDDQDREIDKIAAAVAATAKRALRRRRPSIKSTPDPAHP